MLLPETLRASKEVEHVGNSLADPQSFADVIAGSRADDNGLMAE